MNNKIRMKVSLHELGTILGVPDYDVPANVPLEDLGLYVKSFDVSNNKAEYKPLLNYIVKPKEKNHYELGSLKVTKKHKILVDNKYITANEHPDAKLVDEEIAVVDVSVKDNHNYIANGFINHNTTSGGRHFASA